jgi:hypothetical protein
LLRRCSFLLPLLLPLEDPHGGGALLWISIQTNREKWQVLFLSGYLHFSVGYMVFQIWWRRIFLSVA